MRVLVAPDKFRGTLTAEEACRAIEAGWVRARPGDSVVSMPMADGGEGTLDALLAGAGTGGRRRRARVTGPLGDAVEADYGLILSRDGVTAVIEMARASGLDLVSEARRNALRSTTRGTGELILSACREGAERMVVCIGGSATTDGGAGMAQALGARLLDAEGREIGQGGAALLDLARVDTGGLDPVLNGLRVSVAADVDNPLVGPYGAAHVYAPQKGASHDDVLLLDRALGHFAAVLHRDLGVDLRHVPGAGAAGGLGAGLIVFLGARLRPGVEVVIEALGLRERIAQTDLVITGEGRFDEQSLRGKAPAGVISAARDVGIETLVVCGATEIHPEDLRVFSLAERFGSERALGDARRALEDLALELASARADT